MNAQIVAHREASFQLVKDRMVKFSPMSAFAADSITRKGDVVYIRHRLSPRNNRALTEYEWRQMIDQEIPEAIVLWVRSDRKNIRICLVIPREIKIHV